MLLPVVASLWWVTAARAEETTRTFNATGAEQTFVVPTGVSALNVRARGGRGGGGSVAAEVTAALSVSPGETLYVEVGRNDSGKIGGFNGGAEGGAEAEGGGGATDIRTSPRSNGLSPDTRLLVAGGGGGSGSTGIPGGAAGAEGEGAFNATPGGAGTATSGGEAGEGFECSFAKGSAGKVTSAGAGSLGSGGNGETCKNFGGAYQVGGGGGGGGYYGGGGGGAYYYFECGCKRPDEGAGGGGGSSLVPAGGTLALAGAAAEPTVELSYTASGSAPTVATEAATEETQGSARLNGTVNPNGGEVSECEFEYGPTSSYGNSAPCSPAPGSGTSAVAVAASVSGLTANTTYHFRVLAMNPGGTSYGSDATLHTEPDPPTAGTGAATELTLTGAQLNGGVNPHGGEVSECKFEYGTSTSYGASAACVPAPGSGTSEVAVSASISGLAEGTTYHFRVSARNAGGEGSGSDRTFTTLATPAPPEFGRCMKQAGGDYSSTTCTTALTNGPYEWEPDLGEEHQIQHPGFKTAIKPTTKLLLEVKGGQKIYCTGQTGAGEYSGRKSLANVTLKLTGCYLNVTSDQCQNTAVAGEILSTTLGGTLGIVKQETTASKDKVGLRLTPASGESIAEFTCESTPVSVRGSVIIQGKANAMFTNTALAAAQAKGVQKWTHFIGGAANEDVLEVKIGAGAYTQAGLAVATIQTNEEKIEANTVA